MIQLEHILQLYRVVFSCRTPAQAVGAMNYIAVWKKHNRARYKNDSMDNRLEASMTIKDIAGACENYLQETFK
jgi:hypothetical protein